MSLSRLLRILLIVTLATGAVADELDQQSSFALALNQDLPNGFDLEFLHDLRFKDDNSNLKKSITEAGISYRINKYFRVVTSYRYSIYPDKYSERGSLAGVFGLKTGRFSHRVRVKYQHDTDYDEPSEQTLRSRYALRHKRIKGYRPFIDIEGFYSLENSQLAKHRENVGVNKKLTKRTNVEIYYRFQEELNISNPKKAGMVGLKFEIEI